MFPLDDVGSPEHQAVCNEALWTANIAAGPVHSVAFTVDSRGSRDKLQSMPFQLPGKKPPVAEQCFWLLGNVVGKTGIDMPGTL